MLPTAMEDPSGIEMVSVCKGVLWEEARVRWIQDYKPNTLVSQMPKRPGQNTNQTILNKGLGLNFCLSSLLLA